MISKLFHDRGAQIHYASVYAEGLAHMGRYSEAQGAVKETIRTADNTPGAPYPSMAKSTEVEILAAQKRFDEALKLLDESEAWAASRHLKAHLCAAEINRGDLFNRMGETNLAIAAYRHALQYAAHLSFWRDFTSTGGSLAKALAGEGRFNEALETIDEALDANTKILDELYFVPRNLAIKAEILRRMGRISVPPPPTGLSFRGLSCLVGLVLLHLSVEVENMHESQLLAGEDGADFRLEQAELPRVD